MSENDTVQPATPTEPSATAQPSPDYELKFKGQVKVIQDLTLENRSLKEEITKIQNLMAEKEASATVTSSEHQATVTARDKQIEELVQSNRELNSQLEPLQALKTKLDVVTEMNVPHLMPVLADIPNITDPEALKKIVEGFSGIVDSQVKLREQQLMSGVIPQVSSNNQTIDTPSSDQA